LTNKKPPALRAGGLIATIHDHSSDGVNSLTIEPVAVLRCESVPLLLGLITRVAVALLQFANHLVLIALDIQKVIICQFAKGLFDVTGRLLPFAFQNISIHAYLPPDWF
jgi:hypothetical protein